MAPTPALKNSRMGFKIALMSMSKRVVHIARGHTPLPIKNGLNPSRARVPEEFDGISALDFLWHLISTQRRRNPSDDISAARSRFNADEVLVTSGHRGWVIGPTTPLEAGQDLWFYRTPLEEPEVPFSCSILFENDRILVVNKPPFLATMPRGTHITQTATVQMRRSTGIEDLAPAHRLDRLTSGILVFTKERKYRGAYQTLFAERKAKKTYEAIAQSDSTLVPGTHWRHRMEKIAGVMQASIIDGEPNAETVLVDQQILSPSDQERLQKAHGVDYDLARYTLAPLTGKTHQLRLHMFTAGVPILGDPAYPILLPDVPDDFTKRMHLHARSLTFIDPYSDEPVEFCAGDVW